MSEQEIPASAATGDVPADVEDRVPPEGTGEVVTGKETVASDATRAAAVKDGRVTTADNGDAAKKAPRRRTRRVRTPRTFPASSFMEALPLAEAIQRFAAGQRVRRLTLFEKLDRSADSGPTRQLITNSTQYGLTKGSYSAEWLELTPEGALASSDDTRGRERLAARLELAIARIEPFNKLYEQFKDNRLPTPLVMRDFIVDAGVAVDNAEECVETFLANARDLGLVRTYAGAERLLTFELLLDEEVTEAPLDNESLEGSAASATDQTGPPRRSLPSSTPAKILAEAANLSDVCFLVSPIGTEGSEQRKHANLVLGSLIEPALEGLGLRLVRADKISTPGVITAQVIDHIVRSPLVVADLSFGNPNVYYELALRHACRKPAVQVIRSSDHLPFDVGQFRTVTIDMTDIFTLVPQIDSYRSEIARQCRAALDESGPAESPLSLFYPRFWVQFDH